MTDPSKQASDIETPQCAHQIVRHETYSNGDGTRSSKWKCRDCGHEFIARAWHEERTKELREALERMVADVGDLDYPERDVYGERDADDVAAPLWTEAGLYGRVGKEAARTLLARRNRAVAALKNEEARRG